MPDRSAPYPSYTYVVYLSHPAGLRMPLGGFSEAIGLSQRPAVYRSGDESGRNHDQIKEVCRKLSIDLFPLILDCTPKLRQIGVRHFSLNGERRCQGNSGTLRNFESAQCGG